MNNANNKVISLKMLSYLKSTAVILFFQKEDFVIISVNHRSLEYKTSSMSIKLSDLQLKSRIKVNSNANKYNSFHHLNTSFI